MFKTPWQIQKNNMIFIQPILLFILIAMMALTYFVVGGVVSAPKIIMLDSVFFIAVSFTAGMFHINKLAINDFNPDDTKEEVMQKTIKNFRQFFTGVGESFVRFLFAYVIYIALYFALIYGFVKLGLYLFGEPKILINLLTVAKSMTTQADLINYLNNVSVDDKIIFANWVLSVSVLTSIINFFGFLYFAVLTYAKKNVFVSLFQTFVFFFKNILGCFGIIAMMYLFYMLLNVLSIVLGNNSFSFVLVIILFVLYLNYYILLVSCFYNEKTKNNSNNGTEFIG